MLRPKPKHDDADPSHERDFDSALDAGFDEIEPGSEHDPSAEFGAESPSLRKRKRRRVKQLAVLPSLLTFANGVCGFAAIIALAKANVHLQEVPRNLALANSEMGHAALLIGLGMVFDALDGKVARLTGTAGKFGAQLDSLCDVVTFGVAPAVFLRVFGEATFGTGFDEPPGFFIRALWGASALYLVCVLFRLARFNVESLEDENHSTFRGLPSPAGAGGVISLFLVSWHFMGPKDGEFAATDFFSVAVPAFGVIVGLLMISRIKYQHVFNRLLTGARTVPQMVAGIVAVILIYTFLADQILPLLAGVFILYILSGPVVAGLIRVGVLKRPIPATEGGAGASGHAEPRQSRRLRPVAPNLHTSRRSSRRSPTTPEDG